MFLGNSYLSGNLPICLAICCEVNMDYWVLPCILEVRSINCIRKFPIQLRKYCMIMYRIRMSTLRGTHCCLMTAVHYRKAQLLITVTFIVSLRITTAERTDYLLLLITAVKFAPIPQPLVIQIVREWLHNDGPNTQGKSSGVSTKCIAAISMQHRHSEMRQNVEESDITSSGIRDACNDVDHKSTLCYRRQCLWNRHRST